MFKWLCKPKLSEVLELYLKNQKLAFSTKRITRQAWGQMVKEVGDIRIGRFDGAVAEKTLALWLKKNQSEHDNNLSQNGFTSFLLVHRKEVHQGKPFRQSKAAEGD